MSVIFLSSVVAEYAKRAGVRCKLFTHSTASRDIAECPTCLINLLFLVLSVASTGFSKNFGWLTQRKVALKGYISQIM